MVTGLFGLLSRVTDWLPARTPSKADARPGRTRGKKGPLPRDMASVCCMRETQLSWA